MRADLVTPDSPRWPAILSEMRHDFYHLPAYVRFAARRQESGEPLAFVAEEDGHRFFVPLIVRSIPPYLAGDGPPLFDATGPHGYPGPLVALDPVGDADGFVDRAIDALADALHERGVVAAFVRLHPLLPPPLEPLRRAGEVVDHGDSVSIDFRLSMDELRRQTRENHLRDIRKATASGYAARIDERWERLDEFVSIYAQSMRRLGAHEEWSFSRGYFLELRQALGDAVRLCVVEVGQELASAALLTEVDGIVEYHLAGTADRHVAMSPSKLLVDYARYWAKGRGARILHLAGSLRRGDSLANFKLGFSPLVHVVYSWRLVTDRPVYDGLVVRWEATHGVTADAVGGYFPAYRSPGPPPP